MFEYGHHDFDLNLELLISNQGIMDEALSIMSQAVQVDALLHSKGITGLARLIKNLEEKCETLKK